MDFFGIGGWELLLILVIAVIVMGPGKIVGVARTLGKITHALKKASSELTSQITKELEDKERKPPPESKEKEGK